jgi:ribonuclease Z
MRVQSEEANSTQRARACESGNDRLLMRPLWHPQLVNGRFGDPALYVESLFERDAVLFDLGEIQALPPRKINRVGHIFISHTHIDHFIGFDHLLRLLVGREKTVHFFGPSGLVAAVEHKLRAYCWNLADRYPSDLVFIVTEITSSFETHRMCFRLWNRFIAEEAGRAALSDTVCYEASGFRIRIAFLDHRIPCLGYVLEERSHVNIWKNQLDKLGLPIGPWLQELKRAVRENCPDEHIICVTGPGRHAVRHIRLGELKQAFTVSAGQRIGYITDVAPTTANCQAIVNLVKEADILFIEAAFAAADTALATQRAHLTTTLAGRIAREAAVKRIEPFHFSARYEGRETELILEAASAFAFPS